MFLTGWVVSFQHIMPPRKRNDNECPDDDVLRRRVKIINWTKKHNTKGDPTAYRFLVSYADDIYFMAGRIAFNYEEYQLASLVIEESTLDRTLRGHPVMNLADPKELTTDDICQQARWSRYLTLKLQDYRREPKRVRVSISNTDRQKEQLELSVLRPHDDKRAEFYRSIYCTTSNDKHDCITSIVDDPNRDDHDSIPDTDSSINLSLVSGDTEYETINVIDDTILKMVGLEDHNTDNDSTLRWSRVYYDEVSFRKAQKLNKIYVQQEAQLVQLLPHTISMHIPEIIDHLRLVHPDNLLTQKRLQFWNAYFEIDPQSSSDEAEDDP
jgi:hypothetical protein